MGLGAPKRYEDIYHRLAASPLIEYRREKLSADPNNTTWAKSTDGFGHRILSSQGWKPGDYLGAENATHSDHYTAANASHIRVLLRDDNLGLGAKVGGQGNAETFGLSTLSGIFGRLNGKSDVEVQKQQSSLRDAELRTYQAQKFGFMNFVSGGLLVGDKIEAMPDKTLAAKTVDAVAPAPAEEVSVGKKRKANNDEPGLEKTLKRKKRKSDLNSELDNVASAEEDSAKRAGSKKSKKTRKEVVPTTTSESDSTVATDKQAKREEKKRRKAERAAQRSQDGAAADDKAQLKQEKRARKEERRKRKEEKRRAGAQTADATADEASVATATTTTIGSEVPSGVSTPASENPGFGGGRLSVRHRYILQKRMASMDPRALNEILMIKAQA